jgi:hypothetical protein
MTVSNLIRLLQQFPSDLQVYFCNEESSRQAISPAAAVAKLVHPGRCLIAADDDPAKTVSDDFVHAVVIQAASVKSPPEKSD